MAIAIGQIRDLLLPGLMEITGQYKDLPNFYGKIFAKRKSKMQLEKSVSARYMSLPELKSEGGATSFDNNAGQRFVYNMEPVEVGLGYAITRKAIDDNLYKAEFKPTTLGLSRAFNQFWERQAAGIFNDATTYDANIGGDGKALCATDHPYDGGTWANRPSTDLDLNEGSLLDAMTAVRQNFVDEAGLKIYARAEKLIVPLALEKVAIRLLKSELRPGTANNDVNAVLSMSGGLSQYIAWDYLTGSRAWFLRTNIDGLIEIDRVPYETDMWVDNVTDNLLVKAYERKGFFYNDPRAVYGSFPSS
jgi:hypothetical protein